MEPKRIESREELDGALAAGLFLLVKHSLVCPVSARAFAEYREFAAARPDVPTGWLDVIGQRPWSREIADTTGIAHQSPQALLLRDGRVAWHASHGAITRAALEAALKQR